MKFEMSFSVTVRLNKYNKNNPNEETIKEDEDFIITEKDAINILFRFAPSSFILNGYKTIMKYNSYNNLEGISLFKDNYIYIVLNLEQFLESVLEGYMRIKIMNKVSNLLELDVDTFNEILSNNIEDEFDDEE